VLRSWPPAWLSPSGPLGTAEVSGVKGGRLRPSLRLRSRLAVKVARSLLRIGRMRPARAGALSTAAALILAAALKPCRVKARTGGDVPPGVQPARHGSCPGPTSASPPQDAVEHVQGSRAARLLPRPDRWEDHPAGHESDGQAEDQQRSMVSQNIAGLGYHRKLIELAAAPGCFDSAPAYAEEHVRPSNRGRTRWMDGLPLLREAVAVFRRQPCAVPLPVYPMALTFFPGTAPSTKPSSGRRCGQGVQTRRLRCAQRRDSIVETMASSTGITP
jgi:hypothetical protein